MQSLFRILLVSGIALITLAGCGKKTPDAAAESPSAASAPAPAAPPVSATVSHDPITPLVKWQVGSQYAHLLEVTNVSNIKGPNMPLMSQRMTMQQEYSIAVLQETPASPRDLEMEYHDTKVALQVNGGHVLDIDTRGATGAEPVRPEVEAFRRMVGGRLRFQIDDLNRVKQVEGLEELKNRAIGSMPAQGREIFNGMFSEDYLRQTVEFGRYWPTSPIKPGDSWLSTNEMKMAPLGTIIIELTNTFGHWEKSSDRLLAVFDAKGSVRNTGETAFGMVESKIKISSGGITGQTWFDPELGMVTESRVHQVMTFVVVAGKQLGSVTDRAGGQNFTNGVDQSIHVTLTGVAPVKK